MPLYIWPGEFEEKFCGKGISAWLVVLSTLPMIPLDEVEMAKLSISSKEGPR